MFKLHCAAVLCSALTWHSMTWHSVVWCGQYETPTILVSGSASYCTVSMANPFLEHDYPYHLNFLLFLSCLYLLLSFTPSFLSSFFRLRIKCVRCRLESPAEIFLIYYRISISRCFLTPSFFFFDFSTVRTCIICTYCTVLCCIALNCWGAFSSQYSRLLIDNINVPSHCVPESTCI